MKLKNPFYWHLDEKRGWCFGKYWITDFLGGLWMMLGFICIINVPLIIAVFAFALGFWLGRS